MSHHDRTDVRGLLAALAVWVSMLTVAACGATHDPTAVDAGGDGIDADRAGLDAAGADAPGLDAPVASADVGGEGPPDSPGSPDAGSAPMGCRGAEILCDGVCVDVSTSVVHCGGCGAPCGDGEPCVAGVCRGTVMCPPGTVACGRECRDVSADPEFCGSCTRRLCAADEVCADGDCACRPGLTSCDGACVDVTSDPASCGGCNAPCARGQVCTDGACGAPGACALTVCDASCVDTETDRAHCGRCGEVCAVDQVCIAGACEDYEPAPGCASCGGCDTCPRDAFCCDLAGYGASCLDRGVACP